MRVSLHPTFLILSLELGSMLAATRKKAAAEKDSEDEEDEEAKVEQCETQCD